LEILRFTQNDKTRYSIIEWVLHLKKNERSAHNPKILPQLILINCFYFNEFYFKFSQPIKHYKVQKPNIMTPFAVGRSTIYSPIRSATTDDKTAQNALGLDQFNVEFLPTIAVLAQAKQKLSALSLGDIVKITNTENGRSTFALVDNVGSGNSFADLTPETAKRLGIPEVRTNEKQTRPAALTNEVLATNGMIKIEIVHDATNRIYLGDQPKDPKRNSENKMKRNAVQDALKKMRQTNNPQELLQTLKNAGFKYAN
jgi:hypothetical protein